MNTTDGEVIRYIDGWAWGITSKGDTVCLGTEPDIKAILLTNKRPTNPTIASVIAVERTLATKTRTKERAETAKEEAARRERHKRAVEAGVAKLRKTKK